MKRNSIAPTTAVYSNAFKLCQSCPDQLECAELLSEIQTKNSEQHKNTTNSVETNNNPITEIDLEKAKIQFQETLKNFESSIKPSN